MWKQRWHVLGRAKNLKQETCEESSNRKERAFNTHFLSKCCPSEVLAETLMQFKALRHSPPSREITPWPRCYSPLWTAVFLRRFSWSQRMCTTLRCANWINSCARPLALHSAHDGQKMSKTYVERHSILVILVILVMKQSSGFRGLEWWCCPMAGVCISSASLEDWDNA